MLTWVQTCSPACDSPMMKRSPGPSAAKGKRRVGGKQSHVCLCVGVSFRFLILISKTCRTNSQIKRWRNVCVKFAIQESNFFSSSKVQRWFLNFYLLFLQIRVQDKGSPMKMRSYFVKALEEEAAYHHGNNLQSSLPQQNQIIWLFFLVFSISKSFFRKTVLIQRL